MKNADCVMVGGWFHPMARAGLFRIGLVLMWMASLPDAAWAQCTWSTSGTVRYCDGEVRVGPGTGSAVQFLYTPGSPGTATLGSVGSIPVLLRTNGTEQMRITTVGDVGIGTGSPYHWDGFKSLTVGGLNGGEVRVGQSTGWCQGQFYSTCDGAVLGTVYDSPLVLRTNGSEKMRIASGGNVGIGTTNPGIYKLAVEGTIAARDVMVTNVPFADYVFRPGYRLLPLSEVNAFIQKHRTRLVNPSGGSPRLAPDWGR